MKTSRLMLLITIILTNFLLFCDSNEVINPEPINSLGLEEQISSLRAEEYSSSETYFPIIFMDEWECIPYICDGQQINEFGGCLILSEPYPDPYWDPSSGWPQGSCYDATQYDSNGCFVRFIELFTCHGTGA